MGKRELLIIAAFVVIGAVAYQLTAPRSTPGAKRLSFSSLIDNVRREVRGNRSTASVTSRGTVADVADLNEVRIANVAEVSITGEARQDIGYELTVDAYGPDESTARESATRAALTIDRVGASLRLRVPGGRGIRQIARLSLAIPVRLAVFVDGNGTNTRVRAEHVAALHLDGVVGDSTATTIAGAVTGSHRNGSLAISDAGSVTLALVSSRLSITRVAGAVSLIARAGRAEIGATTGPIELDGTNEESTITSPVKPVRIGGTGGRVHVIAPQGHVVIDVRRTAVEVTLERAVEVTATTTDAPIQVWLKSDAAVAVDAAAADGGLVDASAFGLTAISLDQESRLRHAFHDGTTTVALRNQRGNIVLAGAK
jgi:hypothetical protein